jgi:hypothetical protein
MSSPTLTTITNGTPNDADEVMSNFNAIVAALGNIELTNLALALANTFLKLDTHADLSLKYGTGTSAGLDSVALRSRTPDIVITHGLGRVPAIALIQSMAVATSDAPATVLPTTSGIVSGSLTTSQMTAVIAVNGTSNNTVAYTWIVIG